MSLMRIRPFYYIHVLDNNTNTQRVEVGPQTFTIQDHEKIITSQPVQMVTVPPGHYVRVKDPYIRKNPKGLHPKEPKTDKYGQAELRHGDYEIRFSKEWPNPFYLYPGENLDGKVSKLQIIGIDEALRLKAERDFVDENKEKRVAGDEWLFLGPATYRPRVEEKIVRHEQAKIIQKGSGIKLQANKSFVDYKGNERQAGEIWIVRQPGAYLLHVDECFVEDMHPIKLTQTKAVHLKAIDSYIDEYKMERKAGEEWLVTYDDAETHMLGVFEEKVGMVEITTLGKQQYCIILNPIGDDGKNQYGIRQLRKGEVSFFLKPGESLERPGIQQARVLSEYEGLLVKANEGFLDTIPDPPVQRKAGQWWMILGPTEYVPPPEVEIDESRKTFPLDKNEGIYVRSWSTGLVRAIIGETYMLKADESLYEKDLLEETESLLQSTKFSDDDGYHVETRRKSRDRTRVVTYRVPHNSVVQIFDYKKRTARVVRGPELVMLQPDEQFTVLSLSGKLPKRPNTIKTIAVRLGPDFMTDLIEVETSDHARLRLQMAYNWKFNVVDNDYDRVFSVRDFVGDACKAVASRVRAAAAATPFDHFHKHSADLITKAVFGEKEGKIQTEFEFVANGLCITNIDIQSVEPVDQQTRDSLMKSVQLAIKITAEKQERKANHLAQRTEQKAKGEIEKQKILNSKNQETDRKEHIELQEECRALEQSGSAKAEARARAAAGQIKGDLEIQTAQLNAEASNIEAKAQLEDTIASQNMEVAHKAELARLELQKAEELAQIESDKFKNLVGVIGPSTIEAIAKAGPEIQLSLLQGLGLKGYLMTDGNSPINLFNAAKGMVAN